MTNIQTESQTKVPYSIKTFRQLYFPPKQDEESTEIALSYQYEGGQIPMTFRTSFNGIEAIEFN